MSERFYSVSAIQTAKNRGQRRILLPKFYLIHTAALKIYRFPGERIETGKRLPKPNERSYFMPNNVAFYTTGDINPCINDNLVQSFTRRGIDTTVSNLYRRFAANHARRVFGVSGINDALQRIRSLDAGSVRNFYFIGHGNDGIYAFQVTPDGRGGVALNSAGEALGWVGTINPLHRDFINQIVRVADRSQQVTVNFYSCYTANGNLLQEIHDALDRAGISHTVLGTRNLWELQGQAISSTSGTPRRVDYREIGTLETHLP